jgi:recombinational DNA repair ATPase RecF
MRLKTVTLKNFRCFESLTLDLHPQLTVIVGNNGAGKTALLDGIATGLTPVLTHLSSANQRLSGRGFKDADFRIEGYAGRGGKTQWAKADFAHGICQHSCPLFQAAFGIFSIVGFFLSRSGLSHT